VAGVGYFVAAEAADGFVGFVPELGFGFFAFLGAVVFPGFAQGDGFGWVGDCVGGICEVEGADRKAALVLPKRLDKPSKVVLVDL